MTCLRLLKYSFAFILFYLIAALPLTLLWIYKSIIHLIVKILHRNWTLLTPNDLMAGANDGIYSKPLLNLGFLLKVQGRIDLEALKAKWKGILQDKNYSNLHCDILPSFGGYAFKRRLPGPLEIDSHVREGQLGQGQALEDYLVQFLYEAWEEGRPLCRMVIIPSGAETLVLFKIHHTLADGSSLLHLMDYLMESKSSQSPNSVSSGESIWQKILIPVKAPLLIAEFMGKLGKEDPKILPGIKSNLENPPIISLTSLDLSKVKLIRKKTGSKVISILHAIVGGAIKRHLALGNEYYVGISSIPKGGHRGQIMGNHWLGGAFRVALEPLESPLERLKTTNEDVLKFYREQIIQILPFFGALMSLIPVPWMTSVLLKDTGMRFGVSPVLASHEEEEQKFLGAKVNHIYPMLGMTVPFVGFSMLSVSHSKDQMDVWFSANPDFAAKRADLDSFEGHLKEELQKLVDECAD